MDCGVDHFVRILYGIGYSDATTRATLLYRSGGEGSFRLIERASLRNEEELTVPFLFLPGTDHGYVIDNDDDGRSEEHTSELQSLMRISYAVFCLKKKNKQNTHSDHR